MTYPGTQRRTQTALESSLIAQVLELEKERDELVRALEGVVRIADRKTDEFDAARAAIAKAKGYPK